MISGLFAYARSAGILLFTVHTAQCALPIDFGSKQGSTRQLEEFGSDCQYVLLGDRKICLKPGSIQWQKRNSTNVNVVKRLSPPLYEAVSPTLLRYKGIDINLTRAQDNADSEGSVILVAVSGGDLADDKQRMLVRSKGSKHFFWEDVVEEPVPGQHVTLAQLFFNWLAFVEGHGIRNIAYVCLDSEAQTFLRHAALECAVEPVFPELVYRPLEAWVFRAHLVSHLVQHLGLDVLVSDIDAVWAQNPLPYLAKVKGDIVGLRGNGHFCACEGLGGLSRQNIGRNSSEGTWDPRTLQADVYTDGWNEQVITCCKGNTGRHGKR